jgi:hypothetical protein
MSRKLAVTNVRKAKPLPKPKKKDVVGRIVTVRRGPTVAEINEIESENEVIRLRVRGWSYTDIAKKLQVSVAAASALAQRAYKRIHDTDEGLEDARRLDVERIEQAIRVVTAELEGDTSIIADHLAKAVAQARASGTPITMNTLMTLKGMPNPDMADKLVKLIAQRTKLLGTEKQPDATEGKKLRRVYIGFDEADV